MYNENASIKQLLVGLPRPRTLALTKSL